MPQWILDLFVRYGYAVVFFGIFLENTGLPIPGETALLAGAALAKFGRLSLPWVMVTAACAAICGDNFGFFIGRRGGRRIAERYGSPLGLTAERLAHFDRFFDRHGPRTVFVARFVSGLRVVCAVLAGASSLRWRTFFLCDTAGAVVWSAAIGASGIRSRTAGTRSSAGSAARD